MWYHNSPKPQKVYLINIRKIWRKRIGMIHTHVYRAWSMEHEARTRIVWAYCLLKCIPDGFDRWNRNMNPHSNIWWLIDTGWKKNNIKQKYRDCKIDNNNMMIYYLIYSIESNRLRTIYLWWHARPFPLSANLIVRWRMCFFFAHQLLQTSDFSPQQYANINILGIK